MSGESANANPYTRGIAEFVSGLRYESIPSEVLARIKLLILDSLGCALYATDLDWSRILQQRLGELDTTQTSSVWGTTLRLSAPHAALVNGTQIQGFEIDDVHRQGVLHVGAVVLPALIAVTEIRPGMSGREFLTAAVAGYEIGPRVGICMGTEHGVQGWHSGATVGVFSAAAGAARGLKLDVERTVHSLGIAGTQSCGLMAAQYGSMVKCMHAGRASQSGLYGAVLADAGFTGIVNVFESEYGGFCTTFSRSTDRFKLGELVSGLGTEWQTMGVSLKFYSCVGLTHTTLDAVRDMQREYPFGADDVESIVVHGSHIIVDHVGWKYFPQGLTSAQHNLSYCVATWLLEGDCFVEQFTEDKVTDARRMAIAEKVSVKHDPMITAKGTRFRHMARAEVILKNGKRMVRTVETARGSGTNFASEEDVVSKFEKLAAHSLPVIQIEKLRDTVLGLEKSSNASQIAYLLAKQ